MNSNQQKIEGSEMSERKYYGKNYDYVMNNIKDVALEKKYFKKEYPYADMSKFNFEGDFDENVVFQGYHIWFKNNSFLSTDINSDIEEFVGLRAKLYSHKMDEKESKRCKGVKKNVIEKNIKFQNYKDCLFSGEEQTRKMNLIRHRNHELYTESVEKIALSSKDDKRIILENKIDTLAYGHYMNEMMGTFENIFGFKP